MMDERKCDLCGRCMPLMVVDAEMSFSIDEHKCVCWACFRQDPRAQQSIAALARKRPAFSYKDLEERYGGNWAFERSMSAKEQQMTEQKTEAQPENATPSPMEPVGAFDPAKGLWVEDHIQKAKRQLDADYPPFRGDPAEAKYDPRAKAMVHTKLDEALLWLGKVGAMFALLLCFSGCGGLAIVRDKLASYGDELAVYCPQTNISQDCVDARRRFEVSSAAIQTATLGEQINRDAQALITQADVVVGAALEWFKKTFLGAK